MWWNTGWQTVEQDINERSVKPSMIRTFPDCLCACGVHCAFIHLCEVWYEERQENNSELMCFAGSHLFCKLAKELYHLWHCSTSLIQARLVAVMHATWLLSIYLFRWHCTTGWSKIICGIDVIRNDGLTQEIWYGGTRLCIQRCY